MLYLIAFNSYWEYKLHEDPKQKHGNKLLNSFCEIKMGLELDWSGCFTVSVSTSESLDLRQADTIDHYNLRDGLLSLFQR